MDFINENLMNEMKSLNEKFKYKLKHIDNINKKSIRNNLIKHGKIIQLERLEKSDLSKFKPMACVDGSVNRFGGTYPHYIDIFQGLGKVSEGKFKSVFKSFVNSPMFYPTSETEDDMRTRLLAKIEVDTALEVIDKNNIKFLLMDGNLIRYQIQVPEGFELLKQKCEENNIILAGFIKESKTNSLYSLFYGENSEISIFDKDLLYGVLNIGESFILSDELNKKINQGFNSILLRISNYPGISGIEVLNSQKDYLIEISNICFSLTSKMSRGVPLIIDIVDKEVKIDDKLAEELIKSYIDQEIIERFFRSERSMRN